MPASSPRARRRTLTGTVTVSGTRVLYNGEPYPYQGLSFFNVLYNDALNESDATVARWLDRFKSWGITALRIWDNWRTQNGWIDEGPNALNSNAVGDCSCRRCRWFWGLRIRPVGVRPHTAQLSGSNQDTYGGLWFTWRTVNVEPTPGTEAWYAQVTEDIIEPERPIVDPHHHLWCRRGFPHYLLEDLIPCAKIGSVGTLVQTGLPVDMEQENRHQEKIL